MTDDRMNERREQRQANRRKGEHGQKRDGEKEKEEVLSFSRCVPYEADAC